ncbi:MAG: 16S rRNA (guanine966-N2)-methyltransferase [Candidatus Omnitrophota bacterium]
MRISSGIWQGQVIDYPKSGLLRPTQQKVKEAMVNMCRARFQDAKVLDLFSGTGALGYEAVSMGAELVDFVELERRNAKSISKNLASFKPLIDSDAEVTCMCSINFLSQLEQDVPEYDLIFADPPYEKGWEKKTLELVAQKKCLTPNGYLIIESQNKEPMPEDYLYLKLYKTKVYGDSKLTIYTN